MNAYRKTYGDLQSLLGDNPDPLDQEYYDHVKGDPFKRKTVSAEDEARYRFYSKAKKEYGGRSKFQDSDRTNLEGFREDPRAKGMRRNIQAMMDKEAMRDDMDAAMKEYRVDPNIMNLPASNEKNVVTKDIPYEDFNKFIPEDLVQFSEDYKGPEGGTYNTRATTSSFDILPEATAPVEIKGDNTNIRKTSPGESVASLGNKAELFKSGISTAIQDAIPQLFNDNVNQYFKTENVRGEGSDVTSVLTKKGKEWLKSQGFGEEELVNLNWKNLASSRVWKDFLGNEFKGRYEKVANRTGDSEPALNAKRKEKFHTIYDKVISDLKEAYTEGKGNSFLEGAGHGNFFLNDVIQNSKITKEMLEDPNPTVQAKIRELIKGQLSRKDKITDAYKKYAANFTLLGNTPTEVGRKSMTRPETTIEEGERKVEKTKTTPPVYGKGYTFKQAFAAARKVKANLFWWKGKPYLGKTESELTTEERKALKRGVPDYAKPGGLKPWPGSETKLARGTEGGGTLEGNFSTENVNRRQIPIKRQGGRVNSFSNGQYVKFEKGGRIYKGTISNYNENTGDFDLR
jgi:hypothetical protein